MELLWTGYEFHDAISFGIKLAQIIFVIWWLIVLLVLFTMSRGPGGLKGLVRRLGRSLLTTWLVLFVIWMIAQLGGEPIPGFIAEPANSLLFFGGLFFLILVNTLPWLVRQIKTARRMHSIRSIHQLMAISPDSFEDLVASTYHQLGFKAKRVGHSGDHGVDVLLRTPQGKKWVVQCKRYRGSVGESIIRDLYGTMVSEQAERAILVTTAEITLPAERWAKGKPIDLIDGFGLLRLLAQARARSEQKPLLRALLMAASWFQPPPQRLSRSTPPLCPRCGVPMALHPLRPHPRPGVVAYRCINYPACRVVLEQNEPVDTPEPDPVQRIQDFPAKGSS